MRCEHKATPDLTPLDVSNDTTGERKWYHPSLSIPYDLKQRPGFVDHCITSYAWHQEGNRGKSAKEPKFTIALSNDQIPDEEGGSIGVAAMQKLGSMNDNLRSMKSYQGCAAKPTCVRFHENSCDDDEDCFSPGKSTKDRIEIGGGNEIGWRTLVKGGVSSLAFFRDRCPKN